MQLMNAASSVSQASSPSRSSAVARWTGRATLVRLGVGPLAMAGFFLPWAHGAGPLAANRFTGFTLVGFAGRLQDLDLTLAQGGVLWAVRLAILGVAISGAWQLLLAPFNREHFAYPLSGWYVVAAAGTVAVVGVIRAGWTLPPSGLLCIMLAATCFLLARLCSALPSRLGARVEDPPPGPQ